MEEKCRKILLEDGTEIKGFGFGSGEKRMVEIVFNTSMAGYQEIISDPSYTDQAVVMTYPLIGNYGICDDDYETEKPSISGLICREYCDEPSNFRCTETLDTVMKRWNIVGIYGIDTRKLARHIRDYGSCRAVILDEEEDSEKALEELKRSVPAADQVARVSTPVIYERGPEKAFYHVAVIDCGIKGNIMRELEKRNIRLTVFPWNTPASKILECKPQGLVLSNGPGDPESCTATIETVRELIGKLPVFGICLGHQIISLALGAETYKLKFGHRGGNHPVKDLRTGKIEITSQNHSFAVKPESLEKTGLRVSHINVLDNTVEGVECPEKMVFSVQYHPESAPGPQDSSALFDRFLELLIRESEKEA